MKKLFILTVMMTAVLNVDAQLKVDSTGIVHIKDGNYQSNKAYLNIDGPNQHIYCYMQANTNEIFIPAGEFFSTNDGTGNVLGLKGTAYGGFYNNYAIGIRGFAYARTGQSGIGVQGCLSTRTSKGTGILGSTTLLGYSYIDSLYAGFFNGLTKVRGNLIVTGNIQGTVLGSSAPSSGVTERDVSDRRSPHLFSDALTGLTANRYYHKLSDETARALNADNSTRELALSIDYENLSEEECLAMEEAEFNTQDKEEIPELSSIEKQVLTKQHYGLDADQLEDVFPDLVYENEDGTKSINYVEMVPILVQAINELQSEIDELKGGAAKKAATRATGIEDAGDDVTMLSLGQNKPNPFGTSTDIEVSVPNGVQKAFIYIHDLQGKKIDQVDIIARGKQTIQLNAASLGNGMYLYSLIADGKVVETRRMIVEK